MKYPSFFLFCMTLLSTQYCAAEKGPLGFGEFEFKREMQTDRPDFTEGTLTVESGHIQVESGYTFVSNSNNGVDTEAHSIPEVLLRLGIAERTELRFFWEGYLNESTDDNNGSDTTDEGVSDFSLGFKHTMGFQDGLVPEYGIIAELGLPTGNSEFTNDKVQPLVKFLWAYDLCDKMSISGNFNFDFPVLDEERFLELSNAVSVSYSLTDALGVYGEYFGFYPDDTSVDVTTRHFLNGGFTYLVNSNVQLDIRSGFGLNKAADDFFSGIGVTFRI